MTQKAYIQGSEYPPLKDGALRVYSMRYCPYAQRTLLVLGHYNIPHEVVNINLKNKPDWFLSRTPFGLVPVLQQDDKLVAESAICDEYLDELYGSPERRLFPADPYLRARVRVLMEVFASKVAPKYYAVLRENQDKSKPLEEFHNGLKLIEDSLQGKYFGGNSPSMLDYHFWPWFERMPSMKVLCGGAEFLPADKFPKLIKWTEEMLLLPTVKAVHHTNEEHEAFGRSFLSGGVPNYDLGLE